MNKIAHVVVLMLEHRSFDSLFGRLYPAGPGFRGLRGDEANAWDGRDYRVWVDHGAAGPGSSSMPDPDPRDGHADVLEQMFGPGAAAAAGHGGVPDMSGFVANYARTSASRLGDVMHGYTPEQLPALSTLARAFAVSDDWFAPAPAQSWINRNFLHAGVSGGAVDHSEVHAPFDLPTVFDQLERRGRSWRVYYHDVPQLALQSRLWSRLPARLQPIDRLAVDAATGRLPDYAFIEPRYFCGLLPANDQRAPHDVASGDALVARCYEALRSGPEWHRTLFMVLHDSHGGIYDHVPPPPAVPPDGERARGFRFDRYGPRVPALLVSPWIAPGTVLRRPPGHPHPFDHTSVIRTLRAVFELGPDALGRREQAAPDVLGALSLPSPSNEGPPRLPRAAWTPPADALRQAGHAAPTAAQIDLLRVACTLPRGGARLARHGGGAPCPPLRQAPARCGSVAEALAEARMSLARFLAS